MADETNHVTDRPQQTGENVALHSGLEEDPIFRELCAQCFRELRESIVRFSETPEQRRKTELQVAHAYLRKLRDAQLEAAFGRREFNLQGNIKNLVVMVAMNDYIKHLEKQKQEKQEQERQHQEKQKQERQEQKSQEQ